MEYHVWWPGGNDPFWLYNQNDNEDATIYYAVSGVPSLRVDGKFPGSPGTLPTLYTNRMNTDTHCTIEVSGNYVSATRHGSVTVRVTPDGSMPADSWVLRIALTSSEIYYNTSYNDTHYNVMFDMLPSYAGTPITLVGTNSVEVTHEFDVPDGWPSNQGLLAIEEDQARVVAFVQPAASGAPHQREIFQAYSVPLLALDPTGVQTAPAVFSMGENYPNPFNPKTTIPVSVRERGGALVEVLSVDGRRVKTLHDGMLGAGQHDFVWDGTDAQGQPVASGIYLAVVNGQAESHSQRMVMLK